MTRPRSFALTFVFCLGSVAAGASCSPSKPRDINFGTEAGADFEVPPDSTSSIAPIDSGIDAGIDETTTTPDAGAEVDADTTEAGAE